jgi:hypothetical protein
MSEEKTDTKFTIDKATSLLKSFAVLMKEGCVNQEVYEARRKTCEICQFNQKRASDNAHFCGSCGCGARDLAKLYIEGVPVEQDYSVRLWMPTSNCPKDMHTNEKGTGNFKPVGGRLAQLKHFTMATLSEAMGSAESGDQLEYINRTVDIVESVAESETELDELTEIFEQNMPKNYNKDEGIENEQAKHSDTNQEQ